MLAVQVVKHQEVVGRKAAQRFLAESLHEAHEAGALTWPRAVRAQDLANGSGRPRSARSWRLSTLPVAPRGSWLTKTTLPGTL